VPEYAYASIFGGVPLSLHAMNVREKADKNEQALVQNFTLHTISLSND